MKETHKQSWSS